MFVFYPPYLYLLNPICLISFFPPSHTLFPSTQVHISNSTYWNINSFFKVNPRAISFSRSSIIIPTGSNHFPSEILQNLIYLQPNNKHLAHTYLTCIFLGTVFSTGGKIKKENRLCNEPYSLRGETVINHNYTNWDKLYERKSFA